MSAVLDLLGVTKPLLRKEHAGFLNATVRSFEMSRAWAQVNDTDHQALSRIRKLGQLLNEVELGMQTIRPDI